MAQVLEDGPRNAVVKFDAAETFDVSTLLGSPSRVSILRLWYDVGAATDVTINWDATVDVLAWECSGTHELDFTSVGGLINNAGAGVTGDVAVTGTAPFSLVIHFRKKY